MVGLSTLNLSLVGSVGSNTSPKGESPVIAATSNNMGVNIPHGSGKVLVEPSQKKIVDASNMQGLTLCSFLDNWIALKMPNSSHRDWSLPSTLSRHARLSLFLGVGIE